jgi:hypothetical protein
MSAVVPETRFGLIDRSIERQPWLIVPEPDILVCRRDPWIANLHLRLGHRERKETRRSTSSGPFGSKTRNHRRGKQKVLFLSLLAPP